MNKKLLTAAVGAALAVSPMLAAQADVKVYGRAQVEIGNTDGGTATTDQFHTTDKSMGRIGVTGSEDLGNGLKAIFKFEWKVDTTLGGAAVGTRESYVGLKTGFGTFKAGAVRSPYKYAGGVKYDPFTATLLEARNSGGMSGGNWGHNGFLSNSVNYSSKAGSLSWGVTYSVDEQAIGTPAGASDGDLSVAVQYKSGPLHVFGALINDDDTDGVTGGQDGYESTKAGASYKFGNMKVLAQFEATETTTTAGVKTETDFLFVGFQWKFGGNNTLVAQIGEADATGTASDIDYTAVGVIHKFSKKTRAFAGVRTTDKATGSNDTDVWTIGLRKDF